MRGVFTALITPFDSRGAIDIATFRALLQDQRAAGITGVIPCGTTGESPTLSTAEKKQLISEALCTLKGSGVKVVAGTGSNNTAETIELSKWASDQGVDGLLIVTPYYNKPSQAGMEAHYLAVAEAVKCELMVYNVPGRTGISLTAETIVKLCDHPRITTVKEATGNVAFTSEILDVASQKSRVRDRIPDVLSGDDATYLPLLSVGAVGVVSVASNLFPRAMVAIQKAVDDGRLDQARILHQQYYPLFRDLFVESNPVPIKHAMKHISLCPDARVRAPLAPMSAASTDKLMAALKRCGLQSGSRL